MKIAILGAGNGGCAAAVDLTIRGFEVSLYSRSEATVEPLRARGGIESIGGVFGKLSVPVAVITCDIEEAIEGADVLMVAVPSTGHDYYARLLAPHLGEGDVVLLHPGHTGGALAFVKAAQESGMRGPIRCCETHTLAYAARKQAPHQVTVFSVASSGLGFAAFPGKHQSEVARTARKIYPAIEPLKNVLETGLRNGNAVLHPVVTIMNTGWIEHTRGDFRIYAEGVTPAVGEVLQAVDDERLAIAAGLGVESKSLLRHFYDQGYAADDAAESGCVYRVVKESPPSQGIKAPSGLDHRFLHEDVGYGLVPMSALGTLAGVRTPTMRALTRLASLVNSVDYAATGRTLEKMGLSETPLGQLDDLLYEGF
jgi:opine dehydrogenase